MSPANVLDDRPLWELHGKDWPNRELSSFVDAGGLRWHLQQGGSGPEMLMLHGTGAATHSWAGLLPQLATHFRIIAPDLPGHGFTSAPPAPRLSLPGMAAALSALLRRLGRSPEIVVGHSAGAAIGTWMALDGMIRPRTVISLGGALLPLHGLQGRFFSPAAKLVARTAFMPRLVAWRARHHGHIEDLVLGTGSRLSAQEIANYQLLVRSPGHVAAALNMMANWDLEPLQRELPRLAPRLVLVSFGQDRTIPPSEARRVVKVQPAAELVDLDGLGHLGHEEAPARVAELILERAGVA
jgi:magnesium chelatase accessory protein